MPYTYEPDVSHARAFGSNLRVSPKNSQILCRVIRNKKLDVVKRLLNDLISTKRSLDGKYYTKAATSMLELVESCEANAKEKGLDAAKLFVHAAATHGSMMRRGRRKSSFGSRMKATNMEVILYETGLSNVAKTANQEKKVEKK